MEIYNQGSGDVFEHFFFFVTCEWVKQAGVFVLVGSLLFARNAGAYSSEAPFRLSTLGEAPGLTHKHKTKPERLARDKHFSLFSPFVSYVGKMLVNAT
jgi:hypothetical protein